MSAVADVIDFVLSFKCRESTLDPEVRHNGMMLGSYVVFFMISVAMVHTFTRGQFSVVLTLGSCVQCLGFLLLNIKARYQKTVAGLSCRTLEMYVFFFFFRLGSTLFKDGYLPVDQTGDHCYQIADSASLLIVLDLIYRIHKCEHLSRTYQPEHDTLPIYHALPACAVAAYFLHANMNGNNFFDRVWMMSTLLDALALLPQLWMSSKVGGRVESLTSHFVASLVLSRGCAFAFWLSGYETAAPKDGSANTGGYMIIGCHGFQLLLCADFMYYYLKGMLCRAKGTSAGGMMLPTTTDV